MTEILTICILTYNRPTYLEECLSSILSQTFHNFKVVVLDDCSSQNYEHVLAKFTDPRIIYTKSEKNVGQIGNFTRAVSENKESKYLMVFHDDDIMLPNLLESEIRLLEQNDRLVFVSSGYKKQNPVQSRSSHFFSPKDVIVFETSGHLARSLLEGRFLHFGSTVYRYSALCGHDPRSFLIRYSAPIWDRPFLLEIARKGPCALIDVPLILQGNHPMQESRSRKTTALNIVHLYRNYREILEPLWDKTTEKIFYKHTGSSIPLEWLLWLPPEKPQLFSFLKLCRANGIIRYIDLCQLPFRLISIAISKILG